MAMEIPVNRTSRNSSGKICSVCSLAKIDICAPITAKGGSAKFLIRVSLRKFHGDSSQDMIPSVRYLYMACAFHKFNPQIS